MPKYAKICNLWTFKLGQKQRATCSIVSGQPSADWPRQRARSSLPVPVPRPSYKCPHGLSRIPSHILTLVQARDHRRSPHRASATARQATRASATMASPPQSFRVLDNSSISFARTREAPQTLRSSRTSPETSNHPPDFFRSPANVDRVSLCTIFQFLTYTTSASLGQAS
jgi:hypothetical protein